MPTILIYDSNDEGRKLIRETLDIRPEWKLVEAATQQAATEQLEQQTVDLVVVDVPSGDPQADPIFTHLRSAASQIPIVVLTAHERRSLTKVDALLLGAASYVPRSVIARDLVVTVDRILTLAGCRRRHGKLLETLNVTESKFTLENNDLSLIPVLVGHLADLCEEFAVCANGGRLRTAVALEEAMSNGIIHGNLEVPSSLRETDDSRFHRLIRERRGQAPYRDRTLRVRGMFTEGEAQVTIRDDGPGFDPRCVADPTLCENLDKPHGRGLFLIKAFMDDVSFNEEGNEIRLVKLSAIRKGQPTEKGVATEQQQMPSHDSGRETRRELHEINEIH